MISNPGNLIPTGTPQDGVSIGRNPYVWLKEGVQLSIEDIGTLLNDVNTHNSTNELLYFILLVKHTIN